MDMDTFEANRASAMAVLEAERLSLIDELDSTRERYARQFDARESRLKDFVSERHEPGLAHRKARRSKRMEAIEAWRRIGLAERIVRLDVSPAARLVVLAFLWLVDFFVFARAIAVATDVEPTLGNLEFWLGGLYGLFVSMVAVFFAWTLKEASVAPAQARLARHVRRANPDAELPRTFASGRVEAVVTGTLFILLVGFAAILRFQANVDENPALVAFQLMLPFVIVAVEYLLHDPLDVRKVAHTLGHRVANARLKRLAQRRATVYGIIDEIARGIDGIFTRERAILNQLLQGRLTGDPNADEDAEIKQILGLSRIPPERDHG